MVSGINGVRIYRQTTLTAMTALPASIWLMSSGGVASSVSMTV